MRRVEVEGVRVEMPSNQPVVLLRDFEESQVLPIWIGAVEASAIAFAQQGVEPPRPLTHDLFATVITALGNRLEQVQITDLRDGVFYAILVFDSGVEVSARPSDAIAIALRTGSEIVVAESVMAQAAVDLPEGDEHEVEEFKEFLDHVTPEDFAAEPPEEPESGAP